MVVFGESLPLSTVHSHVALTPFDRPPPGGVCWVTSSGHKESRPKSRRLSPAYYAVQIPSVGILCTKIHNMLSVGAHITFILSRASKRGSRHPTPQMICDDMLQHYACVCRRLYRRTDTRRMNPRTTLATLNSFRYNSIYMSDSSVGQQHFCKGVCYQTMENDTLIVYIYVCIRIVC